LLTDERRDWSGKETQLNTQLTSIRDKYKETQGNATSKLFNITYTEMVGV